MAEQLYGLTFTEITGKVPVFHPDVRVWEVKDKATGRHVGLFYGDYFARQDKRSGAWASGYRGQRDFNGPDHADHVEQQQLRQGRRRRAGADLARRRRDAVPRVRPRAARPAVRGDLPGARRDAARLRRVPVAGPREVGADARPARPSSATTRPRRRCRRRWSTRSKNAAKFNQGYATVEYLSSAIVDMELHPLPDGVVDAGRVRARDTGARSARRRRSPCATACRSSTTCSRATRTRRATTATCGPR